MRNASVGRSVAVLVVALLGTSALVVAQSPTRFSGRLGWVPISGQERSLVGGGGALSASLARSALSITGRFEGLPANAISASLREGAATGARGPVIAEIDVTHERDGSVSGEVRLDRGQIAALRAGRLYVQVHGENGVPPDNAVLWGWLLAEESGR